MRELITSPDLSIAADDPLVMSIRREFASAIKQADKTVRSFRKIGILLIELKARVPHGSFMSEVESLTSIPHRSASRYMAMAIGRQPRRLPATPPESYIKTCLGVSIPDDCQNGQVANLNPPTEAESIDMEVVDSDEEPDPLVVDESGRGATPAARVLLNSGNNEWYTPPAFIEAARLVMGSIDLDPASSDIANKTVMATRFHSQDDCGLKHEWRGRVWMNPPYSQPLINQFAGKLVTSYESGLIESAVVLVNNATDSAWFQNMLAACATICFPKSRVRFIGPQVNPGPPLQGQAIIHFGKDTSAFVREFKQFGHILVNIP